MNLDDVVFSVGLLFFVVFPGHAWYIFYLSIVCLICLRLLGGGQRMSHRELFLFNRHMA